MKTIAALAVTLVLAAPNILAQSNNPPDPTKSATPPQNDPGVRKLSRRERKDRIAKLPEKYQEFLRDVEPIILPQELDTFLILETDPQRDVYIIEFWRRRDVAQGTTNYAFRAKYYARLDDAKDRFKYLSSDRARVFLIQGEPQEIIEPKCERLLVPIQIWKYFYLPQFGHNVRFVFYMPRHLNDYRLWVPMMGQNESLADLLSEENAATTIGDPIGSVQKTFFDPIMPGSSLTRLNAECTDADELQRALFQNLQNKTDLPKIFDPPPINEEDVKKILKSIVIATPGAVKLPAELKIEYPAKQGGRTDAELTVFVPRASAVVKDVGGTKSYSFDVTGEVLKENQLFENFRYRFDFPGDAQDVKLPLIIDRFLRPNEYKARLRVTDINSGAETIVESDMQVPEILDTPDQQKQKAVAEAQVTTLKDAIESNQTSLRIVPMADELLSGIQHIETIAVGDNIKGVEFYLDGKKVMVKRQPPYTLDLDFGDVPQARRIRAIALDDKGQTITGDEMIVNTGTDPFRVRITSPRVAVNLRGKTRVEMSVNVPDGKALDSLQLYYNDTRVATLYGPPYVQVVNIPQQEGVAYLRAVATLKDDPTPPVEDVVMVNTPQFMEEVNVHLVELPTTVLSNGRPVNSLAETSFKIFDEGKPVKLAKFEHVGNLPLSIGMAVDTSGSMQPRMNEAQKAGAEFFKNVLKKGDKAFLVAFATQPQIVQKWSTQIADMNAGLSKLRAEESTALYDAIVYSLYNFLGIKGQKALVLITDGRDNSSKFSFDQAVEYARRTAVPIYAIGIGLRATDVDVKYKLSRFCSETGGNAYYIDRVEDLRGIYTDIQNELRSQYVLGFYPPEGVKPGSKWREVTVKVSEGTAKTIHGYYP
jgi:Ca-activated chloride channel family protein